MRHLPITSALAAVAAVAALTGSVVATPAAAHRATPECTNDNLTAGYRAQGAGMSHEYGRIVLRNTSSQTCYVRGYGGLSYVGHHDGTQIGAAARRTPGPEPLVVVAPGERVSGEVSATSTAPYDPRTCRPVAVDGFRVYLPDEDRSQFVAHRTTGCANRDVRLLEHRAYG